MRHWYSGGATLVVLGLLALASAEAAGAPSVVLNEIAWGGTAAGSQDEWIELHNCTASRVDMAGWVLVIGDVLVPLSVAEGGTTEVRRSAVEANGYLLLERTDDATVSDVEADIIYKGSLPNTGTTLQLLDAAGNVVDRVVCSDAGWPAGSAGTGTTMYATMERVDAVEMGDAWRTNDGVVHNGLDAGGSPLMATPGAANSATVEYLTAPRVQVLALASGDVACPLTVEWVAADPDGLAAGLLITVSVRAVGAEEWTVLADRLANQGTFPWDCASYAKGAPYELRITATDWEGHVGSATSAQFTLR
jgi:hypothetical protein